MNGSRFRIPMTPEAEAAWIKECAEADREIQRECHAENLKRAPSPEKQKEINRKQWLRRKAKQNAGKPNA
jgi:hypothetical protein